MTDTPPPGNASLIVAQDWTRERVDEGVRCPCCGQFAKVYRRKIHRTIARSLVAMYAEFRRTGNPWVHVATTIGPACEVGKARYWGLVVEETTLRPDGGRSGWWQLTDEGIAFVHGMHTVPKYARIYDGRCLGLSGQLVSIRDCLPVGFDLGALMAGQ